MRPPLEELTVGRDLQREEVPANVLAFLRMLGGPTLIRLGGRDSTRTRVVTTLLHGNEPSGVRAVVRYLRSDRVPATDVVFFVGAVRTALAEPAFGHRALPGRLDANRVWAAPWDTPEREVARAVLGAIRATEPECLVDLHNNTGHNPAYGVAFGIGAAELALVALFADRVVHTPIELRTIVEATHDAFPSVTIECGRAGDPVADTAAFEGLCRLLDRAEIGSNAADRDIEVLGAPVRVCLAPEIDLAFADSVDACAALTISRDIDRHNFERLAAGSPIGWLEAWDPASRWPLEATGGAGEECSRALFEIEEGVLRTRRDFIPIMMTTNREIARNDCLFYAVQPMDLGASETGDGFYASTRPGETHEEAAAWWRSAE